MPVPSSLTPSCQIESAPCHQALGTGAERGRARQLFTEESMEAMIKYYEGETLGLGGKTAGSPGAPLLLASCCATQLFLGTKPYCAQQGGKTA